jgi:hypothetical protein
MTAPSSALIQQGRRPAAAELAAAIEPVPATRLTPPD